jgi:hypothetical protein
MTKIAESGFISQRHGCGSTPKCHGSATLLFLVLHVCIRRLYFDCVRNPVLWILLYLFDVLLCSKSSVVLHRFQCGSGSSIFGQRDLVIKNDKMLLRRPWVCEFFLPFRVSDQGGGIDRETTDKIFKYLYTTAPKVPYPLHVFGFGF